MYLVHVIPAAIELMNEAEDEMAALVGLCKWGRRGAHADYVLCLAGSDARIVASDGSRADTLTPEQRRHALDATSLVRNEHGDRIFVAAPVRYAGARIGSVVLAGDAVRSETLTEAAVTLAALVAPALRTRLDIALAMEGAKGRVGEILGRSPAMAAVRESIARAAVTPFPVLIEGESGTGKELVARALHRLSARRDRRFAALNCAALADELVEAELFGHSRGAFTGAVAPRAGLFEEAHGGSLFLDEIGELSLRAQAKLLRALQEREVRRVGENNSRPVDARILAATNRSLSDMVARGLFRDDLLFRLVVVRVRLPALRERSEDVPLLAHTFWQQVMVDTGKRAVLAPDAIARLVAHTWPGNVRELQNIVSSLAVSAPVRGRVGARHVERVFADSGAQLRLPTTLERARDMCERQTVASAVARHCGRKAAAARELGLTRQGLTKAMRRLRIRDEGPVEGGA